jgi:hypothetical protein
MKVVIEAGEQYKALLIEIADAIKATISFEEKEHWSALPEEVQSGVEESQEQYEQGKYTDFSVVKDELLARKHKK